MAHRAWQADKSEPSVACSSATSPGRRGEGLDHPPALADGRLGARHVRPKEPRGADRHWHRHLALHLAQAHRHRGRGTETQALPQGAFLRSAHSTRRRDITTEQPGRRHGACTEYGVQRTHTTKAKRMLPPREGRRATVTHCDRSAGAGRGRSTAKTPAPGRLCSARLSRSRRRDQQPDLRDRRCGSKRLRSGAGARAAFGESPPREEAMDVLLLLGTPCSERASGLRSAASDRVCR